MALEDFSLDSAREKLEEWRLAKEKAESETQSIRTKLHSAVRKGKAIESERLVLAQKLQDLTADLAQVRRNSLGACRCKSLSTSLLLLK